MDKNQDKRASLGSWAYPIVAQQLLCWIGVLVLAPLPAAAVTPASPLASAAITWLQPAPLPLRAWRDELRQCKPLQPASACLQSHSLFTLGAQAAGKHLLPLR
ncbi:hypothetical protein PVAP13_8KG039201 [Panicum virgatum]|uniref:Uncharacterized protein n=1 Tax=Panicum virgatum TaxID=38727 RepID=A0A8T0PBT7_PANVG|nr:hypothetical protein PVAP13_8KG039201 [Panicum virgatum]